MAAKKHSKALTQNRPTRLEKNKPANGKFRVKAGRRPKGGK